MVLRFVSGVSFLETHFDSRDGYLIDFFFKPLVNPYISQLSPLFKEAAKGGYFIKRKDGTPWQYVPTPALVCQKPTY